MPPPAVMTTWAWRRCRATVPTATAAPAATLIAELLDVPRARRRSRVAVRVTEVRHGLPWRPSVGVSVGCLIESDAIRCVATGGGRVVVSGL